MPKTFTKYGEIPNDRYYYNWLEKRRLKSLGYDKIVNSTFWIIAAVIFAAGLIMILTINQGLDLAYSYMLYYLVVAQLLVTVIDYLFIVPNGRYALGLDEVLSTPIHSKYILDELKRWVRDFNRRHRKPMVILTWVYFLISVLISSSVAYRSLVWVAVILLYLNWLVLHEYLLKSSLAIVLLKDTKAPVGKTLSSIVVWILILSIFSGPFFTNNIGPYINIIGEEIPWHYVTIILMLSVPAVILARILPSLLEKRRRGIWQ